MAQGSERVCVKYCVAYWSLTLNLKDTDLREREREGKGCLGGAEKFYE